MSEKLRSAEDPVPSPGPFTSEFVGTRAETDGQSLAAAVEYVLADCSFAVGQVIGMRMTVDYDAIVW